MIDIGRICVKIAGRDAGKNCVVVDIIDENYVLVDGETRRRKCNILHLEPLDKTADLAKGASHAEVTKVFEALGYGIHVTKAKPKTAPRPRHARKSKLAAAQPAAAAAPGTKTPAAKPATKPAVKKPARAQASADQPTKSALPAAPKKDLAEKKA